LINLFGFCPAATITPSMFTLSKRHKRNQDCANNIQPISFLYPKPFISYNLSLQWQRQYGMDCVLFGGYYGNNIAGSRFEPWLWGFSARGIFVVK
jgi:hypothetical protein